MSDTTHYSPSLETERRSSWGVSSGASSGDYYNAGISTGFTRETGVAAPSSLPSRKQPSKELRVSPVARQQTNALLSASIDDLRRALDNCDDVMLRSNAIEQAKECLDRLWSIRTQREAPFAEVINIFQLLLAEQTEKDVCAKKLDVILHHFEQLRETPRVEEEFVTSAASNLLRNGFDVFRGID